ncbi:LysR family transcriptional regulator [Streptosporangium sp. NPDC000396]|uniref:LysR family transcriptional regulator n=1 Tax=Streptosporangium sp. NPDC000396 TaxID=3366185 RepID=UPI00368CE969
MKLDLNLLVALDVLLDERSVSGAATRLHLSEPAMSRTLGRIRKALGDPVLVRSGRQMVPTPRAETLRAEVRDLVERAQAVFAPPAELDLATLRRTFTLLANDAVVTAIAASLIARVQRLATGVTIRFLAESASDLPVLREGLADLEVGVVDRAPPETRVEPLMGDRLVGAVRPGHPLLTGELTRERFASADHITVSRRGKLSGPVDDALRAHGLERRVVASVPTFTASLVTTLTSDAVGLVTENLSRDVVRALGLVTFPVPLDLPGLRISQAWHPRHDADGGHVWLREQVREVITSFGPP